MTPRPRLLAIAAGLCGTLLLGACQADGSGDNRATRRGAATGALVGLTMGALTGDADLAVRGAIAGGVAGGAAGSMEDLRQERETERTQIMADAVVGRGGGEPVESRPQTWERLNDFLGEWSCSVWGLDLQGQRMTATANWTGTLASTSAARLQLVDFDAEGLPDDVDDQLQGYAQLSYDPGGGYELLNAFSMTEGDQRWVGERMSGEERYSFYYVGSDGEGALGMARSEARIELRFVGRDVFIVDTYVPGDGGEEKQVQSYRFTRRR